MSKKRKKKQAAQQAPRAAQAKTTHEPAAKAKSAAPANTTRRWIWPVAIVALVAAALLLSQTLFSQGKARPTEPWTLTILHTTDVEGYLDPCG